MNGKNERHVSGFGHGFLFGLVIGGVLVFLFTTKKGRKLLSAIIEEGKEGISEVEEIIEDKMEDSVSESEPVQDVDEEPKIGPEEVGSDTKSPPPQKHSVIHKAKRLFKGVAKKSL